MEFNYAHKNTSAGERPTRTQVFNDAALPQELEDMISDAAAREIPVSDRETLCFLRTFAAAAKPKNILELGTAVGLASAALLTVCKDAHITTVERDAEFYKEAGKNFEKLNISPQITQISGDAGEEIYKLEEGAFDLIFMDCAKVQYIKYLPRVKQLLKAGGALIADDVLLFGYVTGDEPTPPKRKMLVQHIREYIDAVRADGELITTILDLGNGIALSVKKYE